MNNFYKKKKIRKNIFIIQKYRKEIIQLKNIHNKNDFCKTSRLKFNNSHISYKILNLYIFNT